MGAPFRRGSLLWVTIFVPHPFMKATPSSRRRWLLILILPAIWFFWGFADDYFRISKYIDIFSGVYREVNDYYVDDVKPGELMKSGIDGMLMSLDPYTNYYPESEIEDYKMKHVSAEYGGIGASSFRKGDSIVIYDVYEGFPAQQTDVRAGDILLTVNGRSVANLEPGEIDDMIKGQSGTTVKLGLRRYGADQPIERNITRAEIKQKNVPYYTMLNDSTGYIKLEKFLQECYSEVRAALTELQKNPGMKSLVFDLRGNGGGLLEESVNILNLFVPKGELLVTQTGKTEGSNNTYTAKSDPQAPDLKVAVLIDKSSASASEITAGNFQDLDRGVVIGQRSFGKGLVQQTRPLTYNAQMKLTVAKYFTASGRCVQTRIYHHRGPDGESVTEVPDSLVKPFKTKGGRTVYDGSAVYPDRFLSPQDTSNITKSLIGNLVIFDYASRYRQLHDSIPPAAVFGLSDSDYADFVRFAVARDYDYSTRTEAAFRSLGEITRREKYFDRIRQELDALGKELSHNKEEDLRLFKDEIKRFLEQEIVSRYQYQTGRYQYMFANDPVMKEALNVLGDNALYRSILKGEGVYKVIGKPKG